MSVLVSGSIRADETVNADKEDATSLKETVGDDIKSRTTKVDFKERARKMFVAAREVLCELCIMVILTVTYASFMNDTPKVSRSPSAYPFFPENSIVRDYYRGELSQAISKARESDIAFVMFYAPWDSESQEIRKEFETTARYMQKLVSFAAVNCWQPDGECRNQYNKVYSWPVIIAYPTHGRGVQYNGPKTALHMIRFLHSVMEPLKRVTGLDLHYLRQKHDVVVLANVNCYPGSFDYSIFYSTALRFLEKDPFQEVAFAVNTQVSSNSQKLTVYTWNSTIIYTEEWKSEPLLNWIYKSIQMVAVWASPTGLKSVQLSNYMQPGPALILFTPRNPLHDHVDYYDLLHEVALEYYYCKNQTSSFGSYLLSIGIHNGRMINYKKSLQPCGSYEKAKTPERSVVTVSTNLWTNNSYCYQNNNECVYRNVEDLLSRYGIKEVKNKENVQKMYEEMILNKVDDRKEVKDNEFLIESYKNFYKTSLLTGFNDNRSSKHLKKTLQQNRCRLRNIAEKFSPLYYSESTVNASIKSNVDITGLACVQNRSLALIAMDSLKYHHFAENLGVDILSERDRTSVVIIDEKMESHYILSKVNDKSLREFIGDYHRNNLKRASYSSSKVYDRTHVYPIAGSCSGDGSICVKELSSENFIEVINQKKVLIVLYHSKQCAFCSGASHKFLTAARIFSMVADVEFARVDGESNSLPWEYTMDTYPTIIYIPDRRKSETRVFPRSTPVTVTSLVNFVLSNLPPPLKIHAMWSLCNRSKFDDESSSCVSSIRLEALELTERTLREWRMADPRVKSVVLDKLQSLRRLQLLLANSPIDVDSVQGEMRRFYFKYNNLLYEANL